MIELVVDCVDVRGIDDDNDTRPMLAPSLFTHARAHRLVVDEYRLRPIDNASE